MLNTMMSTSALLFLITCGQFLLSVQGLTLRLKGKDIIPDGGEVEITDLPVGGCRRYDSLECLSDVKYQGTVKKAYWVYTDLNSLKDYLVADIHCKSEECGSPHIGWQSSRGIYRKGRRYYSAVRLGRINENAKMGVFTCHFEEDSNSPVSVNVIKSPIEDDCVLTAPTVIKIENKTDDNSYEKVTWDPPCDVDYYTVYFIPQDRVYCQNETLNHTATYYRYDGLKEIQIAAHLNDMTNCSKVIEINNRERKEDFDNCDLNTKCYNG